jgi:CheY-like chemotaxis protein
VTIAEAQTVKPHTLLVVDDDPEIRLLLSELFVREGFRVDVADDGASAILFLEHHEPPPAILLDILMPGILGSSVLTYLASKPSLEHVPVAIVSSSPHLAPEGYPLFKKPFRFAPLLEFVRNACGPSAPSHVS